MKAFYEWFIFYSCILLLVGCFGSQPKKKVPSLAETFLTLADISGRSPYKESAEDIRVINVRAKAFIKRNDQSAAKRKALENARKIAVDTMVRELLPEETYNRSYDKIDLFMKNNLNKYIDTENVSAERKIYNDKYYGLFASFKVNRQKILVALQKDLKLINTSANQIITVIVNKKNIDLSSAEIQFSDIEDIMMKQIQTDLNKRGLRAVDFRNAIAHLQTDPKIKRQLAKLSKAQFLSELSGSSAEENLLNKKLAESEQYYNSGLTILQQLAKVIIEVNILSISGNVRGDLALSFNVSAVNVATGTGGTFANSTIPVGRSGGANTIPSAMITALVKDAYDEMKTEFIPQVLKQMSNNFIGGKKLRAFELVMKNFSKRDGRSLTKLMKSLERDLSDEFRYVGRDNSVPDIISVFVRYTGKADELGDVLMEYFEDQGINTEEPTTAPDLTDIVFVKKTK